MAIRSMEGDHIPRGAARLQRGRVDWRVPALLAACAAAGALWNELGTSALALALLATLAFGVGLGCGRLRSRSAAAAAAAVPGSAGAARSAQDDDLTELARQVVPVWTRDVEAAQAHSEQEASALLERFASVSAHLDVALAATTDAPGLELGAVDDILDRQRPALDRIQADARAALDTTAKVMSQLADVGKTVDEMVDLANEVQGIARATHMLALNAAVEATRAGSAGGGFAVVARDVRELAAQSRHAAGQITQHVNSVKSLIGGMRALGHDLAGDDEDLAARVEQGARETLRGLMTTLSDAARNSRKLREAGRQAQADIDGILMSLQGQDRLTQMLQSVSSDMHRMADCLDDKPDAVALPPSAWLERLEASYTMESMRNSHHGTAQVEQAAGVEFF